MLAQILILSLLNPLLMHAQGRPSELKKYSYLTYILEENGTPAFGCGFFLQYHNEMFFVTAGHVVGLDRNTDEKWPGTLNIVLCKEINSKACVLELDISKVASKKEQIKKYIQPDLYFCKIKKPLKWVNAIKSQIPNYRKFGFSKIEGLYLWGYPNGPNSLTEIKEPIDTVLAKGPIIGNYNLRRYIKEANTIDSMTYWVNTTGSNSSFGDSGAPAFFKVGNNFYFGGLCSMGYKGFNVMTVVRPEIIIRKIADSLDIDK